MQVEGNRWQLIQGGYAGDHAPTDEEGYLAFAKSYPDPFLYNILSKSKPLTPVAVYKNTASRWKQFDKASMK